MEIYNDITALPDFNNGVITIGTFDGVHLGHVQILRQLVREAKAVNGSAVVITFYPHPRKVIKADDTPVYLLSTQEEKYKLLSAHGIEHIVCIPFDKKFSEQPARNYIKNFLVDHFHPHTVIIGYDHKFGKDREGDYHLMEAASVEYNFKVKEIPEHIIKNIVISSTKIREALLSGDIHTANEFLGYSYKLKGTVVTGKKLGRSLGYPTANLEIVDKDKLIPGLGIYAVKVSCEAIPGHFTGMLSIGTNPTVNGKARTIEVNIFDFNYDIYGSSVELSIIQKLRNEQKFDSLDELKDQMHLDEIATLAVIKNAGA